MSNKAKSKVEIPTIELPSSESERAFIGSILLGADEFKAFNFPEVQAIQACHFVDPAHSALWEVIQGMHRDGSVIDPTICVDRLKERRYEEKSLLDHLGGSAFVLRLIQDTPHASYVCSYANELIRAHAQRQMILVHTDALRGLVSHGEPEKVHASALRRLEGIEWTAKPPESLFPCHGMKSLLTTDFTMDWIVPGMVAQYQPHLTAGAEKTLKTTLLLYLFICIALGESFMGRKCKRLKVLFMSSESGLATIQETIIRICHSIGVDPLELDGWLYICPHTPLLGDERHMAEVLRLIDETGAEVIGFDPLYMMLNGADPTNLFEVGDRMRHSTDICLSRNVTPFYCHHFRKNTTETANPALENVAYSGFSQYTRQWFLIRRESEYRPGSGDHELAFVWGGSAGQSGGFDLKVSEGACGERFFALECLPRSTRADRTAENKAREAAAKVEKFKQNIDAAFRSATGKDLTKPDIATLCGCDSRNKSFLECLAFLLRTGKVAQIELTKSNGNTYEAFRRVWGKNEEAAA